MERKFEVRAILCCYCTVCVAVLAVNVRAGENGVLSSLFFFSVSLTN